ncbi:chemotaxis protein CheA [Brevibacillus migulae]|uniref:chemotaxis protein CheA n=1 Tax=Brevibacillus migulae TaxID=1644114 RepID=UPI00106E6274|nr:chemotaxis protein CheA [Brevibacillus migulae]
MSDYDLSAYLGIFLDEVDEQLQVLDEQILCLEQNPDNQQTIQKIFRAAHTLKGSSATMGITPMKEVTHRLENVFDLIRNKQLTADVEVVNLVLNCIDYLKMLKEAILDGTIDEIDIDEIVQRLDQVKESAGVSEDAVNRNGNMNNSGSASRDETWPLVQLDESQRSLTEAALASDFKVLAVYVKIRDDALLKTARAFLVHNNLKEVGEIFASFPSVEIMEDEQKFSGSLVFLLVTQSQTQECMQLVNQISDIETVHIDTIHAGNLDQFCQGTTIRMVHTDQEETRDQDGDEAEPTLAPRSQGEGKVKVQQTIRVDVDRLEKLMNLVGELVIDQTRLHDVRNRIINGDCSDSNMEVFGEITHHLSRVISDLQEGMMKTRMLPIEQLFNRFPRMIRDLAQKIGKEIDFIIEGKETELDRTLIEEIGDPLIHLLRNAVDHGIELPQERVRQGKPAKGTLYLRAAHQENHIVISISDDGKGIDPAKIKASAIKKGIYTQAEAEALTDREVLFSIFQPGFSTAEQVTDISGRGVGMDIVRSHIEKLNGMIDIETEIGKGTTFTVKLPLTLAIIRSLLVKMGSKTFAIPLTNVLEIIRFPLAEIKTIKHQSVGVVRGRVLPLKRMHATLGCEDAGQAGKHLLVVVIGLAEKRVGLIVDRTLGSQEMVIKSLGSFLDNPPYLAGATILGDGEVGLILDVASIVKENGTNDDADETAKRKETQEEMQLAVFTLAKEAYGLEIGQVRDIIPVPPIARLNEAPPEVLGIAEVRGVLMPIICMRRSLQYDEQPVTRQSRIIVVETADQLVGLLVDRVNEVLQVDRRRIQVPSLIQQERYKAVQRICQLPDRIVFLPNLEEIMHKTTLPQVGEKERTR